MYIEISQKFLDELNKNTFLKSKIKEFFEAMENDNSFEFLSENPDFVQMVRHLANSEHIRIVYDE